MHLAEIEIENFKKISKAKVKVGAITVLVGGNDSGKSSFIQALHFGISAAHVYFLAGKKTFPQERLQFCPTYPFYKLSNKGEYQNQSNFFHCRLQFEDEKGNLFPQNIRLYRAKNDNVGFEYLKSTSEITKELSSPTMLFSVFVPGVSGIPHIEPLHLKSQIRRGIASGDANIYLRSVIYHIHKKNQIDELTKLIKTIFPHFFIRCIFDEEHDTAVQVLVSTGQGGIPTVPIELAATGVLQIIQIFAYVILFKPKLLLLDEPDAHIHPDRQLTLAKALLKLTQRSKVRIILTTHSKHLIAALSDHANFYGFKNGTAHTLDSEKSWLPLAQELGITSELEQIGKGSILYLVITEDAEKNFIKALLVSNGVDLEKCLFSSYSSSSQLPSAIHLAHWVKERFPKTQIVIHRDRDVFSKDEIEAIKGKYNHHSFRWLITDGTDIESYFCKADVITELTGMPLTDSSELIARVAKDNHNQFVSRFSSKRNDANMITKKIMDVGGKVPSPTKLATSIPLPDEQIVGKDFFEKIKSVFFHEKQIKIKINTNTNLATLRNKDIEDLFSSKAK